MQEQGIDLTSAVARTEMTPRTVVSLMLRPASDLTAEETLALKQIGLIHPEVRRTQILLQQFLQMLRQRRGEELEQWLSAAFHADIPEFRPFVRKLRQDQMAVQAGLTLKWNNGPAEGQINRLKLLRPSRHGRANSELLRQRVLHSQ